MLLKDYPCDLDEMMRDWKVSDRHRRCTSVLAFSYEALLLVLILISTYELISLADNSVLYNAPCKVYIENCCQHLNHSLCKNQSGDTETEMTAVQPSSKACSKEWSTVKILNFIVSSQLLIIAVILLMMITFEIISKPAKLENGQPKKALAIEDTDAAIINADYPSKQLDTKVV